MPRIDGDSHANLQFLCRLPVPFFYRRDSMRTIRGSRREICDIPARQCKGYASGREFATVLPPLPLSWPHARRRDLRPWPVQGAVELLALNQSVRTRWNVPLQFSSLMRNQPSGADGPA